MNSVGRCLSCHLLDYRVEVASPRILARVVRSEARTRAAWGLDLVRVEGPGGATIDAWSRGTRIFEKREGGCMTVRRHLSFPWTPRTGRASTCVRDPRPRQGKGR
jgi:hypothetical protein